MEKVDYTSVNIITPERYKNMNLTPTKKGSIPAEGILTAGRHLKFFKGNLEVDVSLNYNLPESFLKDPIFSEKIIEEMITPVKLKINKEIDSAQEFIDKIRKLAIEREHQGDLYYINSSRGVVLYSYFEESSRYGHPLVRLNNFNKIPTLTLEGEKWIPGNRPEHFKKTIKPFGRKPFSRYLQLAEYVVIEPGKAPAVKGRTLREALKRDFEIWGMRKELSEITIG